MPLLFPQFQYGKFQYAILYCSILRRACMGHANGNYSSKFVLTVFGSIFDNHSGDHRVPRFKIHNPPRAFRNKHCSPGIFVVLLRTLPSQLVKGYVTGFYQQNIFLQQTRYGDDLQ